MTPSTWCWAPATGFSCTPPHQGSWSRALTPAPCSPPRWGKGEVYVSTKKRICLWDLQTVKIVEHFDLDISKVCAMRMYVERPFTVARLHPALRCVAAGVKSGRILVHSGLQQVRWGKLIPDSLIHLWTGLNINQGKNNPKLISAPSRRFEPFKICSVATIPA